MGETDEEFKGLRERLRSLVTKLNRQANDEKDERPEALRLDARLVLRRTRRRTVIAVTAAISIVYGRRGARSTLFQSSEPCAASVGMLSNVM